MRPVDAGSTPLVYELTVGFREGNPAQFANSRLTVGNIGRNKAAIQRSLLVQYT